MDFNASLKIIEAIEEQVLILSLSEKPCATYGNRAFFGENSENLEFAHNFIENWDNLIFEAQNLNDATITNAVLVEPSNRKSKWEVKLLPIANQKVACIFKRKIKETYPTDDKLFQLKKLEEELEEQRKVVLQLKEELHVLKCVFEVMPVPAGAFDMIENGTCGKYVVVNSAFASRYNRTAEEMKGMTTRDIGIPPEIAKWWCDHIVESRTLKGKVHFKGEQDGYVCSCVANHIFENRFAFSCANSLELKKLREELEDLVKSRTKELEEALHVKGRFLAIMSHEIRTPLTGLSAALTLLSETLLSEEQVDLTKIARVCGDQLLVVINDVLDLSKMEENRLSLESLPVDILKVMEESLDIIAIEAEKKNIELILNPQPNMPRFVMGDATRIRQVLVNLLTNAIKFTETGEVKLNASSRCIEERQYEYAFSVQDTGIGIAEEAKSKIFQPFSQADTSVTRKYGGSGLGLAITKRLVEQMSGGIWFDSRLNEGTTFHATIKVNLQNGNNLPVFDYTRHFLNKRALIIIFNDRLRNSIEIHFQTMGFETIAKKNPEEALDVQIRMDMALIEFPTNSQLSLRPLEPYNRLLQKMVQLGTAILTTGGTQQSSFPHLRKPLKLSGMLNGTKNIFHEWDPILASHSDWNGKRKRENETLEILIAEDNLVNQKVIIKMLNSLGYNRIHAVDNGLEAVNAALLSHFDVILMDIMMPTMGGIQATQIIREKLPLSSQPIIVALTANAFVEEKEKFIAAGMNEVITKPINRSELANFLSRLSASSSI